jgi:hypothetical protein
MWATLAVTAVGILGVIWGSNHPASPFEDMYNSVSDTLSGWFGKNNQKEKSNDEKEDK